MRTVGVVTVARSDYGIYLPILREMQRQEDLAMHLIVSGMHLSPEFGQTIGTIKEDGFPIGDQFEMLLSSDSPEGVAKSTGLGIISFAQSYARFKPDILLLLGDRTEMLAAAVARLFAASGSGVPLPTGARFSRLVPWTRSAAAVTTTVYAAAAPAVRLAALQSTWPGASLHRVLTPSTAACPVCTCGCATASAGRWRKKAPYERRPAHGT